MSEQFSNTEQALIERLRRAPQPELSAEARQMISARMLDALNRPPLPAPRPVLLRPAFMMVILAVGAVLIASGILFVLSRQNQNVLPTPTIEATITLIPTETVEPTATPIPTDTAEPTATMIPATSVPLVVSSPVLTSTATSTPAPTSIVTVIQGPVERIDGNVLIIYGIRVEIDPNNPILKTITIGDVLRVEGTQTGTPVIIIAPTIIAVTVTPNTNVTAQPDANTSSSGQVWQDDGTCNNPPPDWAPANGWRRRCQGQTGNTTGGGNNGNGNSNGSGSSNGNNGNGNGNSGGKPNKP
jgi:uncharacterized membrane protein YgcG